MTEQTTTGDKELDDILDGTGDGGKDMPPEGQTVTDTSVAAVSDDRADAMELTGDSVPTEDTRTVKLYDQNEGLIKRSGGPYLDHIERVAAEKIRAAKEGREPDLENPPAVVGTPLVPFSKLVEKDVQHNHGISEDVEPNVESMDEYKVEVPETTPDETQEDTDHEAGPYGENKGPWGPGERVDTDNPPKDSEELTMVREDEGKKVT